jgi:transcription initiation factor TFIID subunit 9B
MAHAGASADAGDRPPESVTHVESVLRSMGFDSWEADVPRQCAELASRYLQDVLTDARVYAEHANRSSIQPEDAKLAVQAKLQTEFTCPPPREQLMELASATNRIPLPEPPQTAPGCITLPAGASLLAPNTQIRPTPSRPRKRQQTQQQQSR